MYMFQGKPPLSHVIPRWYPEMIKDAKELIWLIFHASVPAGDQWQLGNGTVFCLSGERYRIMRW